MSHYHLAVCLDEFVFRHNRRLNLAAAFQTLLGLGTGRGPTTYDTITGAKDLPTITFTSSMKERAKARKALSGPAGARRGRARRSAGISGGLDVGGGEAQQPDRRVRSLGRDGGGHRRRVVAEGAAVSEQRLPEGQGVVRAREGV